MKPLSAEELAKYWKFEPVVKTIGGKFSVNQFFGKERTSPALIPLYARFGWVGHNGLDIKAEYVPTYAPFDGTILNYRDEENDELARGDFVNIVSGEKNIGGQLVRLRAHWYHLSQVLVKESTWWKTRGVTAGQKLAITGNTGRNADGTPQSTGPHLHFGLYPEYWSEGLQNWEVDWFNGYGGAVDPLPFFRPVDITNYPTDIKSKDMPLRLIKGANNPQVYVLGADGRKHYVYNESQLIAGARIGLWTEESGIETKVQAAVDEIEEGEPLLIGLK